MQGEPTCYRDGDRVGEGREEDCKWTQKKGERKEENERESKRQVPIRKKGERERRAWSRHGNSLDADDMVRGRG